MPTQSRQQPTPAARTPAASQAPAQAPTGPGRGPGWAASRQGSMGNEAVRSAIGNGTIGEQIPSDIALEEAGVSFRLPGGVALTGGWNQLQTTAPTGVWIQVSQRNLRVIFSPPLLLDAVWPLSNVAWSGFTYDFAQGRISHFDTENTQIGIPIDGKVRSAVTEYVTGLVAGTPIGRGGYDPLADSDLAGTLRKVQSRFQTQGGAAGGGGGDLRPEQITGLGANATIRTTRPISAGVGASGITLPAGATISLSAAMDGNAATAAAGRVPTLQSVSLSSTDLTLVKDGKPIARVTGMRVDRGGTVDVTDFQPLGKLAEAGAGESLIRLLGVMVALEGGDARLAGGGDLSPRVVNGVAEREIERGLTSAVQQLLQEHRNAVPGVDLAGLFGLPARS